MIIISGVHSHPNKGAILPLRTRYRPWYLDTIQPLGIDIDYTSQNPWLLARRPYKQTCYHLSSFFCITELSLTTCLLSFLVGHSGAS
jgi:hypothetical protein